MKVLIEAGYKGWQIIEYREFLSSAQEYYGSQNVKQLIVHNKWLQFFGLLNELLRQKYDIYLFSPRTLSSQYSIAIIQALFVFVITSLFKVRVHCCLSDAQVRLFRHISQIVTIRNGVIHCLIQPTSLIRSYFPLGRLSGPYILPISRATYDYVLIFVKLPRRFMMYVSLVSAIRNVLIFFNLLLKNYKITAFLFMFPNVLRRQAYLRS